MTNPNRTPLEIENESLKSQLAEAQEKIRSLQKSLSEESCRVIELESRLCTAINNYPDW